LQYSQQQNIKNKYILEMPGWWLFWFCWHWKRFFNFCWHQKSACSNK